MRPACYSFEARERDSQDTRSMYIPIRLCYIILYSWYTLVETMETRSPALPTLGRQVYRRCCATVQLQSKKSPDRNEVDRFMHACLCSAYRQQSQRSAREIIHCERYFFTMAILFLPYDRQFVRRGSLIIPPIGGLSIYTIFVAIQCSEGWVVY